MAAATAVLAMLVVFMHPAPLETEASWSDAEHASSGFTALVVPTPPASGCAVNAGALGAFGSFSVSFSLPSGYAIADANYAVAGNAAMTGATAASPTVTGPTSGTYVATFPTGILGLLGANAYLGIRLTHSSGWSSPYRVSHGVIALLAINSSCTVL